MSEEITTEEYYWNNGNLNYRINYKGGKRHGICEFWYENKNLCSRFSYKNGKWHGLCEWWYSDGILEYRKYYFNDKEVTEFEFYVLEVVQKILKVLKKIVEWVIKKLYLYLLK